MRDTQNDKVGLKNIDKTDFQKGKGSTSYIFT
jgi:hypothetical protein